MKNSVFFLLFTAVIWACDNHQKVRASGNGPDMPHHIKLSWEMSPATSQAVSWRTSSQVTTGYVEYLEATATPFFEENIKRITASSDTLTSDDGCWTYHQANMGDLSPDKIYSYRVGDGNNWSEWSEFKTASGGDEPFKFVYFGDVQRFIQTKGSRIIRQAMLNNSDARFMLFAGDLVHRGALNIENWNEFFPAGGWIFQNIPTIATPGNHEHKKAKSGQGISPLWALNFVFPKNGPDNQIEESYFIDYNNIRVISLNSSKFNTKDGLQKTLVWFEDRLKEFTGDWIIVTHHHAMSAVARNRGAKIRYPEFKALYEKYNVPLVLTGHEHAYARGKMGPRFPTYVVSVAGPYQNAVRFEEWMERVGASMQLFQEIYVTSDTLHYKSKTVLGDLYDEFIITKDEDGTLAMIENDSLPAESLIPTKDFERRYDKEEVETYDGDRAAYLSRKKD